MPPDEDYIQAGDLLVIDGRLQVAAHVGEGGEVWYHELGLSGRSQLRSRFQPAAGASLARTMGA